MARLSWPTGSSNPPLSPQNTLPQHSLPHPSAVPTLLSRAQFANLLSVAQIQFDSPQTIAAENYPAHVKEVLDRAEALHPWVKDGRALVAKPDMLIKRRGKSGLLCLNKGWEDSRKWIEERAGKLQTVSLIP